MKIKHTPGPWELENSSQGGEVTEIYITKENAGCLICINNGDEAYDIESDLANAHLIAAAPDLLEACIQLLNQVPITDQKAYEAYRFARAAINKALE